MTCTTAMHQGGMEQSFAIYLGNTCVVHLSPSSPLNQSTKQMELHDFMAKNVLYIFYVKNVKKYF